MLIASQNKDGSRTSISISSIYLLKYLGTQRWCGFELVFPANNKMASSVTKRCLWYLELKELAGVFLLQKSEPQHSVSHGLLNVGVHNSSSMKSRRPVARSHGCNKLE